jgi:hypothetical protein
MALVSASLDAFLFTSTIMISAWAYLTRRLHPFHSNLETPYASFHAWLNIFVLLHTLCILCILLVKTPPNIFTRLHIPLTMSSDKIRTELLKHASVDSVPAGLPKHLETLLKRLSSFDARNIYVRFCLISSSDRISVALTNPAYMPCFLDLANQCCKTVNIVMHMTNTRCTRSLGRFSNIFEKQP